MVRSRVARNVFIGPGGPYRRTNSKALPTPEPPNDHNNAINPKGSYTLHLRFNYVLLTLSLPVLQLPFLGCRRYVVYWNVTGGKGFQTITGCGPVVRPTHRGWAWSPSPRPYAHLDRTHTWLSCLHAHVLLHTCGLHMYAYSFTAYVQTVA